MLPQRLATGATGVKQARYRRGPTRERGTRTRMRCIYMRRKAGKGVCGAERAYKRGCAWQQNGDRKFEGYGEAFPLIKYS